MYDRILRRHEICAGANILLLDHGGNVQKLFSYHLKIRLDICCWHSTKYVNVVTYIYNTLYMRRLSRDRSVIFYTYVYILRMAVAVVVVVVVDAAASVVDARVAVMHSIFACSFIYTQNGHSCRVYWRWHDIEEILVSPK